MSELGEKVYLPLEIRMLIQEDCAKETQRPATRILWILTEHYKNRLPLEIYEELHIRYGLTAFQQREMKAQKEEQKGKKKEKGNVKLQNQLQQINQNIFECEYKLKNSDLTRQQRINLEFQLPKLKERKTMLEAQLKAETEPQPIPSAHKSGKRT